MDNRLYWVDSLRGACILFVIIFHWLSMLYDSKDNEILNLILVVSNFVSPFRMEILFFLSGLMVSRGIKKGFLVYTEGKIKNILYPYVLWSLILIFMYMIKSLFYEPTNSFDSLIRSILFGVKTPLWFIYTLFIFYMIIPFLRNLGVIIFLLSIVFFCFLEFVLNVDFSPKENGDISFYSNFYFFLYFYLADYLVNKNYLEFFLKKTNKFISFISFLIVILIFYSFNFYYVSFFYLVPVVFSIPVIVYFFNKLKYFYYISTILEFFGKNSIVFYLVHYYILMVLINIKAIFVGFEVYFLWFSLFFILIVPYMICIFKSKYDFLGKLFSLRV